jgi:hypothetical protein
VTHEEFIAAEKRLMAERQAQVHMECAIRALTLAAAFYEKADNFVATSDVQRMVGEAKEIAS